MVWQALREVIGRAIDDWLTRRVVRQRWNCKKHK